MNAVSGHLLMPMSAKKAATALCTLPVGCPSHSTCTQTTMPIQHLAATLMLTLALTTAQAQMTVAGQSYEATVKLASKELQLNGVGVRAVAIFKAYTVGLYLTQKANTAEAIIATTGPKHMQMRMLMDVDAKEFVKAVDVGMKRNTPEAELPSLVARMTQFEDTVHAVNKVRKGDVVDLDWLPGKGMQFKLNGQTRGAVIEGEDFYAALLRIFIGDKPVDKALKAGLLGA